MTKDKGKSNTCNIPIGQDLWLMDRAAETARHLRAIHRANPKVAWLQPRHFAKSRGVRIRLFIVKHRVSQTRVGGAIVTPSRAVDSEFWVSIPLSIVCLF